MIRVIKDSWKNKPIFCDGDWKNLPSGVYIGVLEQADMGGTTKKPVIICYDEISYYRDLSCTKLFMLTMRGETTFCTGMDILDCVTELRALEPNEIKNMFKAIPFDVAPSSSDINYIA